MAKIRIGAQIVCRNGDVPGELDRVIVDPISGRVTDLVIRATGLLTHDVVVPIALVHDWNEGAVTVDVDMPVLDGLPDYREEEYVSPDAWEVPVSSYTAGEVLMPVAHLHGISGQGDPPLGKEVSCRDGVCGVVDEVLSYPITGKVVAIRIGHRGTLTRDVVVPVEWVLEARGERVILDCNVHQLEESLPPASSEKRAA